MRQHKSDTEEASQSRKTHWYGNREVIQKKQVKAKRWKS